MEQYCLFTLALHVQLQLLKICIIRARSYTIIEQAVRDFECGVLCLHIAGTNKIEQHYFKDF